TLMAGDTILASRTENPTWPVLPAARTVSYGNPFVLISKPWKIFEENAGQIRADIPIVTKGRISHTIDDPHTAIYGVENLFVEEGMTRRPAMIIAECGAVCLGMNTTSYGCAVTRGACAICGGYEVDVGAKIRGDTPIGPDCKVGGEVAAAVIYGHSNKSHDG